jgi:hypothetical protein
MTRAGQIEQFLAEIDREVGSRLRRKPYSLPDGAVGDVEIAAWPVVGHAQFRKFNLHDGLTPSIRLAIRDWYLPLAMSS